MQATERRDVNGRKTNQATIWSTAVSSYKHGGYRVFVAGLWPTIIRAVPVNIVRFLLAAVGDLLTAAMYQRLRSWRTRHP